MSTIEPPDIRLKGLNFAYGKTPVIEAADLEIPSGQVTLFAGPNGGGKTTLLRLLLGLEKAQSGSIEVLAQSPERARKHIGYMPQHVRHDPLFPVTALEVVLMGRMGKGRFHYNRLDRVRALEALDRVGLSDKAYTTYATLSGGQRQRILMARAIVSAPKLLLMDEPTSMIDAASQHSFTEMLKRIRGACGIVIVSHDLGFISEMVDQVVLVNRTISSPPVSRLNKQSFEVLYGEHLKVVTKPHSGETEPEQMQSKERPRKEEHAQ